MNPLLTQFDTPFETVPFDRIKTEHFLPAFKEAIKESKAEIQQIVEQSEAPTFENTLVALENSGEKLSTVSSVFFNLNSAETSDEIQKLAREVSPLLTEHHNDILLNSELFQRIEAVHQQGEKLVLETEDATLLDKTYKGFVRNGAKLNEEDKKTLREIDRKLSQLSLQFGENVLKDSNAYEMHITDKEQLVGLPMGVVEAAAMAAKERGKKFGWVITLDFPSYVPFITYSSNRELREKLMKAYGSRSFKGNEYDNREIVKEIVSLRHQRANLLGFKSHADFILQERMAGSPEKVLNFLKEILHHAKPVAKEELEGLSEYARKNEGPEQLQRWDYSHYAEKYKKEKFQIDDEMLKPYFQLEKVLQGAFNVANKLYGLTFEEQNDIPVYHQDVRPFVVRQQEDNKLVGIFYADFFPRAGKRNGAWMTSYRGQKKDKGHDQRPHISIVCNFTKPTESKPSLLTFNEVTTLFHEFGHALHGLLADGKYESLTGTNVYWDFVELPSQVMENWVYEKECLDMFAQHYENGEKIPQEMIERIKESANFNEGNATVRQVSFATLDMAWHKDNPGQIDDVDAFEKEVMKEMSLLPPVPGTNMSCSFSHIFQGGYASGYYSYKWAEVLDADAFEFFQEEGIFNKDTADLFRKHVLSAGGSEHPMELYKRFRGKEPSPKALLKRSGLLK